MTDKKIKIKKQPKDEPVEELSPGDTIDFGLTEHVKADNGRETWIRFGVTSAVRHDETTEQAETRVGNYVNRNIQEAIESR